MRLQHWVGVCIPSGWPLAEDALPVTMMQHAVACAMGLKCYLVCSVYELRYFNIADNEAEEEE